MSTSSSSSSSNLWLASYTKLQFFKRIRRFLRSKTSQKISPRTKVSIHNNEESVQVVKEDDSIVLQRSVKKLHFGSWEEKETAAMEIGRLAKEDVKTRKLMAELGVIPVLVDMVSSEVACRRLIAVQALIELANGTYTNKALIVEAQILSKLPNNIKITEESTRQKFAELILSLSSLANTEFPISSSKILPFLVEILESSTTLETKQLCLATLYNISTVLENAGPLVSNGVVQTLLGLISVKQLSEKSLATLSHLVVTVMGKKAIENNSMVPGSLIEILTWGEKPKCQELSAYLLMILAYQSSVLREKMAKSGIVPALVEVSLLGNSLAQKRALKLLQWFKDERQMGPHSGPQTGRIALMGSPVSPRASQEGRKMMKNLVKQSLYKNMEMIARRANNNSNDSSEDSDSKLKSLVISTSSKSLPY
ncbi:U-box domain-containing protein 7 [Mercurialis annua]|uniref:U-box domain-containing protein 7 n=1 Tax=Mercurialis annua TaxID=3986 RepID=UPI00216052F5|nr:U-box domain-containing protein 7 [Mercurialis annua]